MPVRKLSLALSNPFNMNGNNSNRSAVAECPISDTEQLACLLVSPGEVVVDRARKHSAPPGSGMATVVERKTPRPSRFTLGSGRRTETSPTGKKKKGSDKKAAGLEKIDVERLKKWETSFSAMLGCEDGIKLFEDFLKSEFSDENIHFWKACERYKTLPEHTLDKEAEAIFSEYIAPHAPKMVNIDYQTTQEVKENMKHIDKDTFSKAQQSIYLLMARDSFVRFVKSDQFQQALKR